MAFTYHIALTGTAYEEFIPSVEPKVTYTQYSDEIFPRPAIGEIKIGELRNDTIYSGLASMYYDSSQFENQIKIIIKQDGTNKYYFRTSISNTILDSQNKLFRFTPEPDDNYQSILDVYEKRIYETDLASNIFNNASYYYWSHPTNVFTNASPAFTSFSDSAKVVAWQYSGSGTNYARLDYPGCAQSGDQVKINITSSSGGGTIRLVNVALAAVSNSVTVTDGLKTMTATAEARYIELAVDTGTTGGFTYEAYAHQLSEFGNNLKTVIDYLLDDHMGTGITCKSTILFADTLPSIAPTYIEDYHAAYPASDYVTESKGPIIFNDNLSIGFAEGFTDDIDSYVNNEFTIKEIFDILKYKFKIYWYIDSDEYLRFEHRKYFDVWESQLDLRSNTFAKFKPEVDCKVYNYDKSDIYNQIKYSENNAKTSDFLDIHVDCDVNKTSPKTSSISPPNLSTDIDVALTDEWSLSGFVLVITSEINGDDVVQLVQSITDSGAYSQNGYLSWAWVSKYYFNWGCDADEAITSNGETITAESLKPYLIQNNIKFYYSGSVNWYQSIVLSRGIGWIKKIEHDLSSGFYTIDVGFDPLADTSELTADSTAITADSTLITADAT